MVLTVFVALSGLMLAGCGAGSEDGYREGLTVNKEGQVFLAIQESFDRDYYDLDELKSMAVEEVASYNASRGTEAAKVVEVQKLSGDEAVQLVYCFQDAPAYSGFQEERFFYEKLGEAIKARHLFSGAVLFGKEGEITLDEGNKSKLSEKHVIITETKTVIKPPYDILYYSEGVKILSDGSADVSECSDAAIIVLKK